MRLLIAATLSAAAAAVWAQTPKAPSAAGFYIETRVTTVSRGGSGNATTRTHVERSWTSAVCSRTEGVGYRGDTGAYQLTVGTPRRFYNVMPRERVIYAINAAEQKTMADEAMKLLGPRPTPQRKAIGDGGRLLGHRTTKFEASLTVDMRAGPGVAARAPTVTTFWVADDAADPMVRAYRASRLTPATGAPGAASASGVVLRSETRSQWLRDVTQITTREVVAWRQENVPASRCALPAGYKTVDLLADIRARQAATAELRRLSQSTKPADRARAKALGDSMFREIQRTMPKPSPSLQDDPSAMIIDGSAKRNP